MTNTTRDLIPIAPSDSLVRAWSFRLLLETGRPVSEEDIAAASGLSRAEVTDEVETIQNEGRLTRDDSGRIIGSDGLSVAPTSHEIVTNGEIRWTWCAVDAVGIMKALQSSGEVRSRDIHSGTPLRLTFTDGKAEVTEAVVFVAGDADDDCFVVDQWCPSVNFFADRRSAEAWAAQTGASGEIADIASVSGACSDLWESLLEMSSPGHSPE